MRSSKPITVTLGPLQSSVDARLKSGAFSSASEVMRAALRALDREEAALEEFLRRKVESSLADPRPSIPAEKVFAGLRAHHAKQLKAAKRGAKS
jgi:antitoxin ParD1/3/4